MSELSSNFIMGRGGRTVEPAHRPSHRNRNVAGHVGQVHDQRDGADDRRGHSGEPGRVPDVLDFGPMRLDLGLVRLGPLLAESPDQRSGDAQVGGEKEHEPDTRDVLIRIMKVLRSLEEREGSRDGCPCPPSVREERKREVDYCGGDGTCELEREKVSKYEERLKRLTDHADGSNREQRGQPRLSCAVGGRGVSL